MFAETRRTLEAMRSGRATVGGEAEEFRGEGEAADGRIRATVAPGNRVESLWFDPRLMRMDSQSLSEEILAAVNVAFVDLSEKAAAYGSDQASVDADVLSAQLRDLQDESVRRMAMFGPIPRPGVHMLLFHKAADRLSRSL